MESPSPALKPAEALARWNRHEGVHPSPDPGLINRTWFVGEPTAAVLQWVNPIFDARIHLEIEAVTRRLEEAGLATLRLIPTPNDELWIPDPRLGFWRLLTFLPGVTLHRVGSPAQAEEAGALVGRFHAALADWHEERHAPRRRIHDTPSRMRHLHAALESCDGHPLADETRELGEKVLQDWQAWDGDLDSEPERMCHGDLKISNVRFDKTGEKAVSVIDLDTVEPMPYSSELGDAWRSWCNPVTEDEPELCRFDVDLFAAAARGWLQTAPPLSEIERQALVPGIERICLELTARFAADAVENVYFREDRERFLEAGAHNLLRAHGQYALACSAREERAACEAALRAAGGPP